MTAFRILNQIFYKHNKFDHPDDILLLETFFMNLALDSHICEEKTLQETQGSIQKEVIKDIILPLIMETPISNEKKIANKKPHYFEPKDRDSLFWCIYAFVHGENEYHMIRNNYGNRKLEEKMKVYAFMKGDKKLMKQTQYKITNQQVQEMMSELMCVHSDTSFLVLIALAIFYKIRILLVDDVKKIYIDFGAAADIVTDNEVETDVHKPNACILFKTESKGHMRYRLSSETDVNVIVDNMFRLEHYHKPLKAISNYKVSELESISDRLGLSLGLPKENLKKGELYERISEYCTWK